jgi:hypothetical protein
MTQIAMQSISQRHALQPNRMLCKINGIFQEHDNLMGPTPPGTGVMAEATLLQLLKSTSPTNR